MICVDASLILAFLLPDEEFTEQATALFGTWRESQELLAAPTLLPFEVLSGLRLAVYRSRISPELGDAYYTAFRRMPVEIRRLEGLLDRAWEIGRRLNPPRLYDASYLALADIEDCDVWTADRRFVNLVAGRSSRLRWIGEA